MNKRYQVHFLVAPRRLALVLAAVGLLTVNTGCGKINDALSATESMAGKTDQMLAAIDDQSVGAADDFMNRYSSEPDLPILMIGAGETVGKHLTPYNLVRLCYGYYQALTQTQPDADHVVTDKDSNGKPVTHFPADYLATFNHSKKIDLAKLRVIAGMAPQDKVMTAINDQIVNGGEFFNFIYIFLEARGRFLNDIIIHNDFLETRGLDSLGTIDALYVYTANLKTLLSIPHPEKMQMPITGFVNADGNIDADKDSTDTLSTAEIQATIDMVKKKVGEKMPQFTSDPNYAAEKAKIDSL